MSEPRIGTRGFGYQPERSAGYHFEVRHLSTGGISVWEKFGSEGDSDRAVERASLSAHRWRIVQGTVAGEFNQRLQQSKQRTGRWLKQRTPLAPHFGKELVLLIWAIEDQDAMIIPRMLANWRGLAPEERWWFYTTISASTRSNAVDPSFGWKAAIKIAFLDDPRDLGLESVRVSREPKSDEELEAKPKRNPQKTPVQDERFEIPLQGRLFVEPDSPDDA